MCADFLTRSAGLRYPLCTFRRNRWNIRHDVSHICCSSITDNLKLLTAGLQERGFPNTLGKIDFEADKSRARAFIADGTGLLVKILMPSLQTIEPGRLAYDHAEPILTRAGGDRKLVATSANMGIQSAAICKNSDVTYPTERHPTWQVLNCRITISAQLVRGIRTFAAGQAQSKSSA